LPEAQLDRFMLLIDLGYPPQSKEQELLIHRTRHDPIDSIEPVLSIEELENLRDSVDAVRIEDSVSEYLMKIVQASRQHPQLRLGVSIRGTLLYGRIVRARALLHGRDYVIPEDVKELAIPALAHRVLLDTKAQYGGISRVNIIADILSSIKVPK